MNAFLICFGISMTVNAAFSYWQRESRKTTLLRQASAAFMLIGIAAVFHAY